MVAPAMTDVRSARITSWPVGWLVDRRENRCDKALAGKQRSWAASLISGAAVNSPFRDENRDPSENRSVFRPSHRQPA